MRTTLKIVLPLIVSVAVVSLLFAAYQVRTERRNLRNDLSRRAEILGDSLQETVEPLLGNGPNKSLQRLVARFGQREHLQGVAVYDVQGEVIAVTTGLPPVFQTRPAAAMRAAQQDAGQGEFLAKGSSASVDEKYAGPMRKTSTIVWLASLSRLFATDVASREVPSGRWSAKLAELTAGSARRRSASRL